MRKDKLSPAKQKFAEIYAKTDNATKAVKIAFKGNKYTEGSARVKGHRLLTDANVSKAIAAQKHKMELLATKAVDRIEGLIDSENEVVASQNAWKVYEQVHGRPITKNVSLNANISLEDALIQLK